MRIAVASGKGGTGKTLIATNLAAVATPPVQVLDCDVEAPNAHLFLKPELGPPDAVGVPVPQVDESLCTGCGLCGKLCQYSAIVVVKKKVLTFPGLCHGCGGCTLVCPENAISETVRRVGVVETGKAGQIDFAHGRLRIGEAMSPPLIRAVKAQEAQEALVIVDAPPGTSCPVIEAVRGSDFVILVTEPTPFGLNDLKLAVETMRALALPFGVVINRSDIGDREVWRYCSGESIEILQEIPDERRIAEAYSRGELIVEAIPEHRERFRSLLSAVGPGTGTVPAAGGRAT